MMLKEYKISPMPACAMPYREPHPSAKPLTAEEQAEESRLQMQDALAYAIRQKAAALRELSEQLYDLAFRIEYGE